MHKFESQIQLIYASLCIVLHILILSEAVLLLFHNPVLFFLSLSISEPRNPLYALYKLPMEYEVLLTADTKHADS